MILILCPYKILFKLTNNDQHDHFLTILITIKNILDMSSSFSLTKKKNLINFFDNWKVLSVLSLQYTILTYIGGTPLDSLCPNVQANYYHEVIKHRWHRLNLNLMAVIKINWPVFTFFWCRMIIYHDVQIP